MLFRSSQNLKSNIFSYNPDVQAGPEVGWYWNGSAAKVYDSRNGYLWLCKQLFGWEERENWLWLWRQLVPEKHKFLAWLCLKEALPTASFRFRRVMSSSDMCPRCLSSQESILHCIRDCPKLSLSGIGWIFLVILWI